MTFDEILDQVIALLKRQGRVSYSALRRQFDIDDAYLNDLKDEILYVHESAVEADDRGFTWTDETEAISSLSPSIRQENETESRFHAVLPAVIAYLQREERVTYRTLKHVFGLNDGILTEIRKELHLRRVATDEDGKVLVWTGKTQQNAPPLSLSQVRRSPAIQ